MTAILSRDIERDPGASASPPPCAEDLRAIRGHRGLGMAPSPPLIQSGHVLAAESEEVKESDRESL